MFKFTVSVEACCRTAALKALLGTVANRTNKPDGTHIGVLVSESDRSLLSEDS